MPTVEEARKRMEAALDALRREFATVRTGKATPALLDTVFIVDEPLREKPVVQLDAVSIDLERLRLELLHVVRSPEASG